MMEAATVEGWHAIALQAGLPTGAAGEAMIETMDRVNGAVHQRVAAMLSATTSYRLLEVGFGGLGLRHRLPPWFIDYTGIDWSELAVKRAILTHGPGAFHRASVEHMPFLADDFHVVVTLNSVYWWPDLAAGLAEIKRVLQPGCPLLLGMVTRGPVAFGQVKGLTHYSSDAMLKALEQAGFEVEQPDLFVDTVVMDSGICARDYGLFRAFKPSRRISSGSPSDP